MSGYLPQWQPSASEDAVKRNDEILLTRCIFALGISSKLHVKRILVLQDVIPYINRKKERKKKVFDILVHYDSLLHSHLVSAPNPSNTHKHGITPDRVFML